MITSLFFPVWENAQVSSGERHELYGLYYRFTADIETASTYTFVPYIAIGVLAFVAGGIAFYEIFSYKNRLLQMKLGALNSVVMTATLGFSVWFATEGQKNWMPEEIGSYGIGLFLPPIAMICNILANRFIRRDEKLVQSVDRIR